MVASAAVVIGIVAAVTHLAARRAMEPIEEMIDTAAAIGAGDMSRRIPTGGDIPETDKLGEALNQMLGQLEVAFADQDAAEERLRRFIADASHELRTPLTSIRGYAELYLSGAATDDASVLKAMSRIQSEAVRTGDLVNSLLLLASLDQHIEPDQQLVDVTQILNDCIDDLKAVQPDREIQTRIDDALSISGDPAQMRQVLSNLLTNTRVHAGDTAVTVEAAADSSRVVITISDQGPGMDETEADHAFDRFWRADTARSRRDGGTGLGLAIVRSVIDAHDGSIHVDTSPGAGTTFTIRLPLIDTAQPHRSER